jgi:hypothetical protein
MNKLLNVVVAVALLGFTFPAMGWAAAPCPAELGEAKAALKSAQAAQKKGTPTAKSQNSKAPRALAGARSQDVQAPRAQDVQAPRAQDVQAPRAQDVQAPRAQDVQAPRAQAVKKASTLIRESDAACKKGDMALSTQKAKEALGLLK